MNRYWLEWHLISFWCQRTGQKWDNPEIRPRRSRIPFLSRVPPESILGGVLEGRNNLGLAFSKDRRGTPVPPRFRKRGVSRRAHVRTMTPSIRSHPGRIIWINDSWSSQLWGDIIALRQGSAMKGGWGTTTPFPEWPVRQPSVPPSPHIPGEPHFLRLRP